MLATGLGLTLAFVALRTWGGYGEPGAWTSERTPILTALAFLNCTKNPPSPLFLLMTLGPAIVAMAAFDWLGARGPVGRALLTLGRVPLFFFLLQWYVIHPLAILRGPRARIPGELVLRDPHAPGLAARPAKHLRALGGGARPDVSALLVVCRSQAAPS